MRRINDIIKVADLIQSNFKSVQVRFEHCADGSLNIYVPYLPSNVVSLVSSCIRIGVFPYDSNEVLINVYKI